MGIKANFSSDTIRSRFEKFLQAIERQQIEKLQYLGELCVKHAKLVPPDVVLLIRPGTFVLQSVTWSSKMGLPYMKAIRKLRKEVKEPGRAKGLQRKSDQSIRKVLF